MNSICAWHDIRIFFSVYCYCTLATISQLLGQLVIQQLILWCNKTAWEQISITFEIADVDLTLVSALRWI